jgi:MFS family permease
MVIGGVLSIAAMLILTFTSALPAFLVAMALFGAGSANLGVAPGAVVGDVMRGRGGQVVAVFQMSADFGSIVGPLVAGMLADSLSFGAAFGATAGILVFGPLLALRMPETRWRHTPTEGVESPTIVPYESDTAIAPTNGSQQATASGGGTGPTQQSRPDAADVSGPSDGSPETSG